MQGEESCNVLNNNGLRDGAKKPGDWRLRFFVLNLLGLAAIIGSIWHLHYRTLQNLEVVKNEPADLSDSAKVQALRVEFNSAIDPASVGEDSLQLTPAVKGRVVQDGRLALKYILDSQLAQATRYRVSISKKLQSVEGWRLKEAQPGWDFHTSPLSVQRIEQASFKNGALSLSLSFSAPVRPGDLREHLKLKHDDGSALDFSARGDKPGRQIFVDMPAVKKDRIWLTLESGLACVDGPLGLAKPVTAMIRINSPLVAKSKADPEAEGNFDYVVEVTQKLAFLGMAYENGGIAVRFNSPVEIARAAEFVKIEPEVKYGCSQYGLDLFLSGKFAAGQRYTVTLAKGFPAGEAGELQQETYRTVWIPDREPGVRFSLGGGYLSPQGLLKVPVVAVNAKEAELRIAKLYASNLVEQALGSRGEVGERYSTPVMEHKLNVADAPNVEHEALLDLRELIGPQPRGVYGFEVSLPERRWSNAQAMIVVTDLGLSASFGERQALCWVASLAKAKPEAGVTVTLYSDRRQEIGKAVTGEDGLAEIAIPKLPKDEHPALFIAARGDDMSYLLFGRHWRYQGDNLDEGRPYLQGGYEAFATVERGVYRPGDEARFSAVVRGEGVALPSAMPLDLAVIKPGGRELYRRRVQCSEGGTIQDNLPLPDCAPSGRYVANLSLPGGKAVLGSASFRVEDYIPQTLKLELSAPEAPLSAESPIKLLASVHHLFGDPAAGLRVSCSAKYSLVGFAPKGWDSYVFCDTRKRWHLRDSSSLADVKADEKGEASFTIAPPKRDAYPAALQLNAEVTAFELGGRALSEQLERRIDPHLFYVGVKPAAASPRAGEASAYSLAAVAPDGKAHSVGAGWKARLIAINYANVMRHLDDGSITYEWTRSEVEESSQEGVFSNGMAGINLTPARPGPYLLVVEAMGGCAASTEFYAAGPGGGWLSQNPDELKLSLGQDSHQPGSEAVCTVQAPFPGTALVCIESSRVLERRVVEMTEGKNELRFSVKPEWMPNVYATVTLIRPVQPEDDWRPHRASGMACLKVDSSAHKLELSLDAPACAKPAAPLAVKVQVKRNGLPVKKAAVVLAAVDEGVLGLTKYKQANPFDFFYGARAHGVNHADIYSRLAPELSAWKAGNEAVPGGDGGECGESGKLAAMLNPVEAKRVKTVVLYAGNLVTDESGSAAASFTLPEYAGELRLMAYAAEGADFGLGEKPLPVKGKLMFRASWPRFLAPGDEFEVPVTIYNRTSSSGAAGLSLSVNSQLANLDGTPPALSINDGGEASVKLRFKAVAVGKAEARIKVALGENEYSESVELPVRPAAAFSRSNGVVAVEPGEAKEIPLSGNFLPNTGKAGLVVIGSPLAQVSGSLQYLLRYPYGCLEQTTSAAMPLIYAPDLASLLQPGSIGKDEVAALLAAGFERLEMMQAYSGGLSMWPGLNEPYEWGSIYAFDMLTEARKAGYEVRPGFYSALQAYLERNAPQWLEGRNGDRLAKLAEASYACYALARAGQRPLAIMARLEEIFRDASENALNQGWLPPVSAYCHLAGAYLACGDALLAQKVLQGTPAVSADRREIAGALASPIRDTALLLLALLDVDPESERIPALASSLSAKAGNCWWGTTQENAFALMALGKHARRANIDLEGMATVSLADGAQEAFKSCQGWKACDLAASGFAKVANAGKSRIYAYWNLEGVPADGKVEEKDAGISLRQRILELDGSPARLPLKQGKLYQLDLRVAAERSLENCVVIAPLPAGLEIENQNLCSSSLAEMPHNNDAKPLLQVIRAEPRDDRLILFCNIPNSAHEYSCLVRAVTSGKFALPAAQAGCMYDPAVYSINGRAEIEVRP